MMRSYSIDSPMALSDVVKWELDARFCRDTATLLAGSGAVRAVKLGAVLGQRLFGAPSSEKTGTGGGAMTGLALKAGARAGIYKAVCISAATDAGVFAVYDPSGRRMADATVGAAYDNGEIGFTIADGTPDWAVGATWAITVPPGDLKVTAIDFSAVDGSQRPWGLAAADAEAPDGTDLVGGVVGVRRFATVVSDAITWPAGATSDQKAAALAALVDANVIAKAGY